MPKSSLLKSATSPRSGFSLIEMFVVIGIILILITIMFPSLGLMKGNAENSKCQANLKQLSSSVVYFYHDQEVLPTYDAWIYRSGPIWKAFTIEANLTRKWLGANYTLKGPPLFEFVGDKKPYQCETFKKVKKTQSAYASLGLASGYSLNHHMGRGRKLGTLASIGDPSGRGLIGEENMWKTPGIANYPINDNGLYVPDPNGSGTVDGLGTFHRAKDRLYRTGRANVAFADGHVDLVDPYRTKEIFWYE